MSTPNPIKTEATAVVAKAEAWFKKWYYQVGVGGILGAAAHWVFTKL